MHILWFCIVSVMLAAYAVLDGFDLGAGVVQLLVARTESERRAVLASIGPFWDGNEVWLLAGGGILYFAFPSICASGLSGFGLALVIVAGLLALRFWNRMYAIASLLLAVFYGTVLGNVIRGVPLDENGSFFLPLWTNFQTGPTPGILDWFTVLCGVTALIFFTSHSALWVASKSDGDLRVRCRHLGERLWWAVAVSCGAVTAASFAVQPHVRANVEANPWILGFAVIALAGLLAVPLCLREQYELGAFAGSSAMIAGLLCCAAAGQFPYMLASTTDAPSLTVHDAASSTHAFTVGSGWPILAVLLLIGYVAFVHRNFRARVNVHN